MLSDVLSEFVDEARRYLDDCDHYYEARDVFEALLKVADACRTQPGLDAPPGVLVQSTAPVETITFKIRRDKSGVTEVSLVKS